MNTPFGQSIVVDPSVILRALAISLELDIIVTIKLADASVSHHFLQSGKKSHWSKGAIVYIGTHGDGHQEILPLY